MTVLLDSSAILAVLWGEPGAEKVASVLQGACVSTVNLAEVVGKLIDRGASDHEAVQVTESLALIAVPFDKPAATIAGNLRRMTRKFGLSMADRACLATALVSGLPVLTGDRVWQQLELNLDVELIR